ncbi:hypothetical protein C8R46DRAFT_1347511 [Mycena filopes]|nr:hypothetical protein C8R46DRAFT_1347511 [Mycena filopes]
MESPPPSGPTALATGSTNPTAFFDLPPEIWITVFEDLPRQSLRAIHAVSSLFHDLSLPGLYQSFTYRPSVYLHAGMNGTIRRELDLLAFWSSPKIAPHVRACHVSIHSGHLVLPSSSPIVDALFEAVSHFGNLQSLSCNFTGYMIELPALRIENLVHLKTLHIHGRAPSRPDVPTSFKITVPHFGFTDISLPLQPDGQKALSCLSMLDAAVLTSLELGVVHFIGLEHFLADKSAMASFRSLHALTLALPDTTYTKVHAAISPFPAIRDITVDVNRSCTVNIDEIPSTPLAPQLCRYKGPVSLMALVLPGSEPTHLSVTRGTTAELLHTLTRIRWKRQSITSLAIRVMLYADLCEGAVLLEILALFPRLDSLSVRVSSDKGRSDPMFEPHTALHLSERLINILTVPPRLRRVVFRWRLAREQDNDIVPDLTQLVSRLLAVQPGLKLEFSTLSSGHWGF